MIKEIYQQCDNGKAFIDTSRNMKFSIGSNVIVGNDELTISGFRVLDTTNSDWTSRKMPIPENDGKIFKFIQVIFKNGNISQMTCGTKISNIRNVDQRSHLINLLKQ